MGTLHTCQKSYHGWQHLYYLQVHATVWVTKKDEFQMRIYSLTIEFLLLAHSYINSWESFFVAVVFYILLHFVDACLHNSAVVYSLAYLSWLLTDYSKCIFKDVSGFTIYIFKFSQFHLSTVLNFTYLIHI